MAAQHFRDLIAWQAAYQLTLAVYSAANEFPKSEIYGLTSQIKRASISITSNIAEGFGRRSAREKDQFYSVAHGSLTEVENQLIIALGVGYLSVDRHEELQKMCLTAHKLLYGLRKANKEKGVSD